MKLQTLKISEIIPYEGNPRKFAATVPALKISIERFGYNVPIVVDSKHVIISGHARLQALKELAFEEVAVIVVDLAPEKAQEWRLVDNKASEQATWDKDRLISELRAIEEPMDPFFETADLKSLLGGLDDIGRRTVSEEQVKQADQNVHVHFERLNQTKIARNVFVKCKHCGKQFGFDRPV